MDPLAFKLIKGYVDSLFMVKEYNKRLVHLGLKPLPPPNVPTTNSTSPSECSSIESDSYTNINDILEDRVEDNFYVNIPTIEDLYSNKLDRSNESLFRDLKEVEEKKGELEVLNKNVDEKISSIKALYKLLKDTSPLLNENEDGLDTDNINLISARIRFALIKWDYLVKSAIGKSGDEAQTKELLKKDIRDALKLKIIDKLIRSFSSSRGAGGNKKSGGKKRKRKKKRKRLEEEEDEEKERHRKRCKLKK